MLIDSKGGGWGFELGRGRCVGVTGETDGVYSLEV